MHMALNEYPDVVLFSLGDVPLLRFQSKDYLQVRISMLSGS